MRHQTPDYFLQEEELCGHFVTAETKKLWAVQIECLQELKRVCEKYKLRYFACGGTLLGAVRHKGFIPWDDDIDVLMLYDDYKVFCEVAPKEIVHPFFFQNFKTEPGFGPAMSRIRNSETTGCTSYDYAMADGNYNCGIFMDVFPLFGIEDRLFPSICQKTMISFWRHAIAGYETKRMAHLNGWNLSSFFNPNVWCWSIVGLFINHLNASKRFLKACASAKSYKQMSLLSFAGFNPKLIWNKEWFDEGISLPFEFVDVTCPKAYDSVLRTQYGDYMKFVKGGQVHTMVLCDPETPFSERMILKK